MQGHGFRRVAVLAAGLLAGAAQQPGGAPPRRDSSARASERLVVYKSPT